MVIPPLLEWVSIRVQHDVHVNQQVHIHVQWVQFMLKLPMYIVRLQ